MILLEREDVDRLGLWTYPFMVRWDHNDPVQWAEGNALDFPDIPAEGPFLLVVHDEDAWAGQGGWGGLYHVAQKRADSINMRWWRALADLYAEAMGISRQSLVLRFAAMRRHLSSNRDPWFSWEEVYHWPEGGDLAWSALVHGHPHGIAVREHEGQRQIRYPRPLLDVDGIQKQLGIGRYAG